MMYVFAVLILLTLVLSVVSVDEVTQAAGGLLGATEGALSAGRVVLMVLIVVVLALLIAHKVRNKRRTDKS